MIILRTAAALLWLSLILQACGPLVELEEENVALQSRVDSLEVALVTTGTKLADLRERIAQLEAENLRLSDQSRDLSAKLTEARNSAGTVPAVQAAPPPLPTPAAAAPPRTPSPASHIASMEPAASTGFARHNARVMPDMEWLTRYQDALNSYNVGNYPDAATKFNTLARNSSPNNHIDNCVFWLGQCALMQGRHDEAIALFTTVLSYAQSNKLSDALYSRAETYASKGDTMNARRDYQRILDNYSRSARASDARQRIRALR